LAYSNSVFLNVPFDQHYKPLLEAAVFAIYDCGLVARCASEDEDSSAVRLEKIYHLIQQSKYGIHDISRVELDVTNNLPRFNMPLELGIWLGAKRFGKKKQRLKRALVLDRLDHRFKVFCSDISGHDIRSHHNDPAVVIRRIRNWIRNSPDYKTIVFPGPERIIGRYRQFSSKLTKQCQAVGLDHEKLEFNDYCILVAGWLTAHSK
jgi:hypothetical protein